MRTLDEEVGARRVDEGRWELELSDGWTIAGVPNGGYVMSLVLRLIGHDLAQPDPLTATAHFLGRTAPGPAEVRVEVIKAGRSFSTAAAALTQDGRECLRTLVTFGDLDGLEGPGEAAGAPPDLGPEESLTQVTQSDAGALSRMVERLDFRVPRRMLEGVHGNPTGEGRLMGRIRFADGHPAGLLDLPLIADGFPPSTFQLGHYGWTPTLELTTHARARPAPGWLTCDIRTRYLESGLFEEEVEVWDSEGRLVGLARQLGRTASGW